MYSNSSLATNSYVVVKHYDKEHNAQHSTDNLEGYYKVKIGDVIHERYIIKNILGKGLFANVVRATDQKDSKDVAIKIIRKNDVLYKTSLKELDFLRVISNASSDGKKYCVKFFGSFNYKGHLCLVLEPLDMDLRSVINKNKIRKSNCMNVETLMRYSRQLFLALSLLKRLCIIHADIKPDNILLNEKKNEVILCDFGSATKIYDQDCSPYLVSRFYRASEIILGIRINYGVDIWSLACTMFEMFTGRILFTGSSNNEMLKLHMELNGKCPSELINKGKFKDQHFNHNNNFLLHGKHQCPGNDKPMEYENISANRDLLREIKIPRKCSSEAKDKKIGELKDILEKMLILDSCSRISVSECLRHPFIEGVVEI